jgi:3-hydroxybutyryl-CoA dehydratase
MGKQLTTLDNSFDDLELGDHFVSGTRTVTDDDILVYSRLSGDSHPLHTDDEYARNGPFGKRVAQGCLTLSLATGLEFELIRGGSEIVAFYGMDRVRFVRPVFVGDTLRLEGEVTALENRDERHGIVTIRQQIVNQHGQTVVILDKRTLNRKRGAGA